MMQSSLDRRDDCVADVSSEVPRSTHGEALSLEEALEDSFRRLESIQRAYHQRRIEGLMIRVESLESELDALLEPQGVREK